MVHWLSRRFGGWLLAGCLVAPSTWAQEHGEHSSESHEEHFHRNELALVLASTYEVEESKVNAKLSDGVLTITLPRSAKQKPRTIPVK